MPHGMEAFRLAHQLKMDNLRYLAAMLIAVFAGTVASMWSLLWMHYHYGGVKAYRPAVPFFIGLILGDFMVGAFWNLYGIVMEVQVYRFWF